MSRKRPAHVQQSGVNIVDNKVEGLITYTAPVLADAVVLIQWSTPEAPQTTQPNQLFRLCLITANQDPTGLTGLDTDVDWDVCSCVRRAVSSSRSARTDRLSILRPRPSSLSSPPASRRFVPSHLPGQQNRGGRSYLSGAAARELVIGQPQARTGTPGAKTDIDICKVGADEKLWGTRVRKGTEL